MKRTDMSFFWKALNSPLLFLLENTVLQVLGDDTRKLQREGTSPKNKKF